MALTKISTGMLKQDAASSDLNIDAGTLYLDVSNNRVGVATTSPGYTLDVAAGSAIAARFTGGDSNGITSIFTRASEQGLKTWSGNSYYSGLVAGAHFQIFTNNSPSTPRVTVLDTGKVGIGITDPATNLHISSTDGSTLTIQNSTNSGLASLHFRDESNADSYKIFYNLPSNIAEQHFNGNGIRFYSTQTSAEVAKIGFGNNYNTSYFAGRVGAGTSSPAYPVEISGEGTVSLAYQRTGTGVTAKKWGFHSDNANTYWQNITDSVLAITVANAGNVGIGTTSPQVDFHVNDSSGGVAMLTRTSGNTSGTLGILRFGNENIDSNLIEIVGVQDGATDSAKLEFRTQPTGAATTARMTIKSDGKVGIGTDSPGAVLEISGKDDSLGSTDLLRLQFDNSPADTGITFTDIFDAVKSRITLDSGNTNDLRISAGTKLHLYGGTTNGTTSPHLTVSSNGNVGIRRAAPDYALDVQSDNGPTTARFSNSDSEDTLVRIIAGSYNTELDARLFLGEADTYGMTLEYDGVANIGYIGMNDNVDPTGAFSKRIQFPRASTHTSFMAGNVGIRATNPPHDLTIYNASGPTLYLVGGGYNDDVRIAFGGGDTTNTSSDGNTGAQIISTQSAISGQARGDLRFLTNQGDSLQTRLVIEEAGNIGINNSNPAGLLSLSKGTRTLDLKLETTPATGDVGVQFRANSGAYLGLAAGGGTGIGIVVDSNNKVGIGTIDPMSPLVVKKNGVNEGTLSFDDENNNAHLTLEGADARVRMQMGTYNNGSYGVYIQGSYDNNASGTGSSGTEPIILNPQGGNVGIGETSPLGKLHVKEGDSGASSVSSNFDQLVLEDDLHSGITILSGASSDGAIYFGDSGGNAQGQIKYKHGSDSLNFIVNDGTEALIIDSSNNLLVGTTDTTLFNNTSGGGINLMATNRLDVARAGDVTATFNRMSSNGEIISFYGQGALVGHIGSEGGDSVFMQGGTTGGGGLLFHGSAGKVLPVRNAASIDATIDLGQSSRRFKDLYLSGDVLFSDASSAINNSGGELYLIGASNIRNRGAVHTWSNSAGSSEYARIDSSGRLLVGKSQSNYATEGVEIRSNEVLITKSTTNPLSVRNGANGGLIALNSSGTAVGGIGAYGGTVYYSGNSHALMINGTSVEPSNNSGGRVNNTVDLGSSTYKFKDLNLGGKILVGDNGDYEDTGDNFNGGIVFQTPIYTEYQWKWNGLDDHETNLYCGSYFMAEIVFTQHQTNSGTDINRHLLAKWANNHTHHELETIHDSGSTWSMTTSITATDHNLLATGASGTGAHGRLRIVETYGSGSYSFSTLTVRVYQGTLSNVTHTYG